MKEVATVEHCSNNDDGKATSIPEILKLNRSDNYQTKDQT